MTPFNPRPSRSIRTPHAISLHISHFFFSKLLQLCCEELYYLSTSIQPLLHSLISIDSKGYASQDNRAKRPKRLSEAAVPVQKYTVEHATGVKARGPLVLFTGGSRGIH